MKVVTKSGSILSIESPVWLPHPDILQFLEARLVHDHEVENSDSPLYLMHSSIGSKHNLSECFRFLSGEFGVSKHDGNFHLIRYVEIDGNDYVTMNWERETLPSHQRFLADTIYSKSGDLIKNRPRSENPSILGNYSVNMDAITNALQTDCLVKIPILPFIKVALTNPIVSKAVKATENFKLGPECIPALMALANKVEW